MYGKIFERVFTGSMYGSGPVVFATWAYVIANADPPGVVELNPRLLAGCIGTSTEEIRAALDFLCKPDAESQNEDENGCRLVHMGGHLFRVVSFEKYRKLQSAEDRRAYHREYWHKRKNSTPLNSTQHHSTNSTEAEAEAEVEEKKKNNRSLIAPEGVSKDVWNDWLAIRKAKRKPVTETALKLIRSECDKAGLSFEEALRTACENGWAGFRAEWVAPQGADVDAVMRQLAAEGRG